MIKDWGSSFNAHFIWLILSIPSQCSTFCDVIITLEWNWEGEIRCSSDQVRQNPAGPLLLLLPPGPRLRPGPAIEAAGGGGLGLWPRVSGGRWQNRKYLDESFCSWGSFLRLGPSKTKQSQISWGNFKDLRFKLHYVPSFLELTSSWLFGVCGRQHIKTMNINNT